MDEETEKEIAYAILAQKAMKYPGVRTLNKDYQFFMKKGFSPIAAALLSQRNIEYNNSNRLEEFFEKFKKLDE